MPGFLLNIASTLICSHGGQAKCTMPMPRVRVMGLPVTVQPPPYVNVGPCITGMWVLGALRVKAMGMPVLLQDSQAVCVPTGTPLTVVLTQMRVKGM
jgi:hypothetical protein